MSLGVGGRINPVAMARNGEILGPIRELFALGSTGSLSDGQLLERFATGRGESAERAFAALVDRHGPMVLRVARAILADPDDAHDAFQATFLVLLRRARSLWVRDSLGPWLHRVAHRTATSLRSSKARRSRLDRLAARGEVDRSGPLDDELSRVLHEELGRLPERYRAPVVLCDLEGTTHERAARDLGWPIGTVKSRLTRARDLLRDRLRRRGFAPTAAPLAAIRGLDSPLPPALVASTTRAAIHFISSRTIPPGTAGALAKEVLAMTSPYRWWKVASLLAVVAGAASGVELLAQKEGPKAEVPRQPEARPEAIESLAQPKAEVPRKPDVQAEGVERLPSVVVRPGKFLTEIVEPGVVAMRVVGDEVVSEFEGTTTILSLLPNCSDVKKGDRVGELDATPLKARLEALRIEAAKAQADSEAIASIREAAERALREDAEAGDRGEIGALRGTIARAESAVAAADARLDRTRRARDKMDEALAARGGTATPADLVAKLDLEDRLEDAEGAQGREARVLARARADLVRIGGPTAGRTRRELEGEKWQAILDHRAKRAIWDRKQARIADLERKIASCILVAPAEGSLSITWYPGRIKTQQDPSLKAGDTVHQDQPIFSVFDDIKALRVNAYVRASRVGRVRVDEKVRVTLDRFPGKTFSGVVESVAPRATTHFLPFNKNSIMGYVAQIRLDAPPCDINEINGSHAEVTIPIAELDGVLSVPTSAVLGSGPYARVAVKRPGGGVDWRDVVVGEADDSATEIRDGLKAGDAVFLAPQTVEDEHNRKVVRAAPVE